MSFEIDRDLLICARRATVFGYLTDSERWARWWGAGSRIDPRPGGEVFIQYPGGTATAEGEVVEIVDGERIVFTYGYDRPDTPIAPGGSRVTITLTDEPGGTRLRLRHEVASEALREQHRAGWRHQMAVLAHAVSTEHDADAVATIDRWFAAWSGAGALDCADDVIYRDRFGFASGRADLEGHIAAARRHLAQAIARDGEPRVSLGMAIVDWRAGDMRGSSVFELAPDGRISRVTAFWPPSDAR